MIDFKVLLRKKINKLILVVWPPWGEEKESEIDISFGFIFENESNNLFTISVDKNELWTPHIYTHMLPERVLPWKAYYSRMKMWMEAEDDNCVIEKEYYDVSEWNIFENIVGQEIIGIDIISLKNNPEPFGVKLLFKNDYIITTPNSDGNTVETSQFNGNNNIEIFKNIGEIIYNNIT